jgi:protein-L-isoaspartate(D-aspartate) O-methyltransferase
LANALLPKNPGAAAKAKGGRAMKPKSLLLAAGLLVVAGDAAAEEAGCARERAAMVETIRNHVKSGHASLGRDDISERVMKVFGAIDRQRFVPKASCTLAYADQPVPIGHNSTISQPFIMALMTELVEPAAEHTALEIGTGSGYQAAILARLVRQVCTIELVHPLAVAAAKRLNELGHDNVRIRSGDGYQGWPECGPFDSVMVTAALGHVPKPLFEQLKVGGRLVMPLGDPASLQQLVVLEKTDSGMVKARTVSIVRFVPFVRPRN